VKIEDDSRGAPLAIHMQSEWSVPHSEVDTIVVLQSMIIDYRRCAVIGLTSESSDAFFSKHNEPIGVAFASLVMSVMQLFRCIFVIVSES
jgi:hypothetical protein